MKKILVVCMRYRRGIQLPIRIREKMIRGSWPIAVGASLLLHALIFAATTRLANTQSITEPEFVALGLVSFVDRAGVAKPLADTVTKPAIKPKCKSSKPRAIRKQTAKAVSLKVKNYVAQEEATQLPPEENRTLEKDRKTEKHKPLEEPVAAIPPIPENASDAAVTIEVANSMAAVDIQVSEVAGTVSERTVEMPGYDNSPGGKNAGGGITVSGPSVIYGPRPDYPEIARVKGWTGTLKAKVLISELGMVKGTVLYISSGYSCLDAAALKKLLCWRFRPAYQGRRAIETWVVIPVEFKLE